MGSRTARGQGRINRSGTTSIISCAELEIHMAAWMRELWPRLVSYATIRGSTLTDVCTIDTMAMVPGDPRTLNQNPKRSVITVIFFFFLRTSTVCCDILNLSMLIDKASRYAICISKLASRSRL